MTTVYWDVAACSLVEIYRRFIARMMKAVKHFWNVSQFVRDNTTQYSRRLWSYNFKDFLLFLDKRRKDQTILNLMVGSIARIISALNYFVNIYLFEKPWEDI
jgi:hypothetical protein